MNSLDTNILIYATNNGCEEHDKAIVIYEKLLNNPNEWIISDQVLFEFFRALCNPKILMKPLNQKLALEQIVFLREETGCLHCNYEIDFWKTTIGYLGQSKKSAKNIFDIILGTTLEKNCVKSFFTRNTKDFIQFKSMNIINPIDGQI